MNRTCTGLLNLLESIPHKEGFAYVMLSMSPFAILLSLTLLLSLAATRQVTQNTSSLLIFIITLSDFISGALGMPLAADILLNQAAHGICTKLKIIVIIGGTINFSTILAILTAIDRYLHMNPDIRGRTSRISQIFEKPVVYYLVVVVFFLSLLFPTLSLVFEKKDRKLDLAMGLFSTGQLTIYLLIVSCLYTRGYLRIRKFADSNPVYCKKIGPTSSAPNYVRRLYKTVLTLILLACFHFLPLYFTSIAMVMVYIFNKDFDTRNLLQFYEIALLFFYAHGISNCVAVFCFNKRARTWIFNKTKIKISGTARA